MWLTELYKCKLRKKISLLKGSFKSILYNMCRKLLATKEIYIIIININILYKQIKENLLFLLYPMSNLLFSEQDFVILLHNLRVDLNNQ